MKKELILEIPEIDYVLIHWPDNVVTPWVAAWNFNKEKMCWGQGHYFCTKEDAVEYLAEVFRERYPAFIRKRTDEVINQLEKVLVA